MPYLFRMGKSIETASRLGVAKGWGQEEMDGAWLPPGYGVSFGGAERVLELTVAMATQHLLHQLLPDCPLQNG